MALSPAAKQMRKGSNPGLGTGYCRKTSWRRRHRLGHAVWLSQCD